MEQGKALLTSKTFWVNLIMLIGMVLTAFGIVGEPDWLKYQGSALAVVNVILRLISGNPITGVIKPKEIEPPNADEMCDEVK